MQNLLYCIHFQFILMYIICRQRPLISCYIISIIWSFNSQLIFDTSTSREIVGKTFLTHWETLLQRNINLLCDDTILNGCTSFHVFHGGRIFALRKVIISLKSSKILPTNRAVFSGYFLRNNAKFSIILQKCLTRRRYLQYGISSYITRLISKAVECIVSASPL